jgi:hypothetical protein
VNENVKQRASERATAQASETGGTAKGLGKKRGKGARPCCAIGPHVRAPHRASCRACALSFPFFASGWLRVRVRVLVADWQTATASSSSSLTLQAKDRTEKRARLMSHNKWWDETRRGVAWPGTFYILSRREACARRLLASMPCPVSQCRKAGNDRCKSWEIAMPPACVVMVMMIMMQCAICALPSGM